jgi:hypothetical protein
MLLSHCPGIFPSLSLPLRPRKFLLDIFNFFLPTLFLLCSQLLVEFHGSSHLGGCEARLLQDPKTFATPHTLPMEEASLSSSKIGDRFRSLT